MGHSLDTDVSKSKETARETIGTLTGSKRRRPTQNEPFFSSPDYPLVTFILVLVFVWIAGW